MNISVKCDYCSVYGNNYVCGHCGAPMPKMETIDARGTHSHNISFGGTHSHTVFGHSHVHQINRGG